MNRKTPSALVSARPASRLPDLRTTSAPPSPRPRSSVTSPWIEERPGRCWGICAAEYAEDAAEYAEAALFTTEAQRRQRRTEGEAAVPRFARWVDERSGSESHMAIGVALGSG